MKNSLAGRILAMVLLGISLIAVIVSTVVLSMSRKVFTETYGQSQEKVFFQVENELNDFHTSLRKMTDAIDSSWAFRLFLDSQEKSDNTQVFQNIYQMEQDLNAANATDIDRLSILVVGMNGVNYLSRTETVVLSNDQILTSAPVVRALKEPDSIHYTYSHGAYTMTSRYSDVIIASKALYLPESQKTYGVVLVALGMDDIRRFYDYFTSDHTSWYLVDADGTLMCADKSRNIGKKLEEDWYKNIAKKPDGRYQITGSGKTYTVLSQNLSYLGCHMYGVIDNEMAIQDLYNMPLLILICAVTAGFIMLLCLFYLQKTLHPLSNLVSKMAISRRKEFREYIPVEGTCEVQQLASTYNEMLDDIQNYIGELLDTQRAQRKAEIKALQMQINPHYIYNTLASIKWLVYQNDTEKTTRTIDAFISLLRNTISNTEEMVSVEQELVNIENYILINHTRYGDQIRVEYEIQPDCYNCKLPKLVLQPFVENAFFHGFPSGQQGTICVRMRRVMLDETEEVLEIQVADDGVGMETGEPKKIVKNRKEHFSGIGVHNVQERLALIYGKREEPDFYIHIDSVPGHGTTIRIRIPNI